MREQRVRPCIEGLGPMGLMPRPIALAGVGLLKTQFLRTTAGTMVYKDQALASEDAVRVGRLHCFTPHWAVRRR